MSHSLLKILNDPNLLGGFCTCLDKLIRWNGNNKNQIDLQTKTGIRSFEEMFLLINNSTEFIHEDHVLDDWEKESLMCYKKVLSVIYPNFHGRIREQISLSLLQLPKTQFTDEDYRIYESVVRVGNQLQMDLSEHWIDGNEKKLISDFKNYIRFPNRKDVLSGAYYLLSFALSLTNTLTDLALDMNDIIEPFYLFLNK